MEQIKNFDDFYDIKLKAYLQQLKQQDGMAGRWGTIVVIAALFLVPALVFGLSSGSGSLGGWIVVWAIVTIFVSIYNYTKVNDSYQQNFKEQVVRQVIEFIHPGLVYKPDVCISSVNFKHSSLFRKYYDDYNGDDLVEGTYNDVFFKCSELVVSKRSSHLIFKGLFFEAPLNNCSGGTYVWLKNDLQLPASIADERYRLMPMPDVVKADCRNGDFEKYYAVYTTNVAEAMSLIDHDMMERIMDFRRQVNRDIVLSFVAGMCYVAISIEENLLEPESGDPGDKATIKTYFFTILLMLSIINKLNLRRF